MCRVCIFRERDPLARFVGSLVCEDTMTDPKPAPPNPVDQETANDPPVYRDRHDTLPPPAAGELAGIEDEGEPLDGEAVQQGSAPTDRSD